jgi:serine/threonine protein kinase
MQRKIEKYEIMDEIGHGGMATVFRARDSRLDRPVALKVMHPHLRGAREARVRFAREARSVARLRHSNILEIYDNSEEDSDECYIVTELLTGPTLKAFAEKHPEIPPEVAACFTIEIARALGHAHSAGIIHRDVKPENVLLHENRCIKLTDFGIAQMVDTQGFTATGQILGSPGHMAPEQVEGKDCDARADIFSLGTVLYYLATSRLPFWGRNPHQVLKRIMDGEYPDPVRTRAAVGGKLGRIIDKALARDPEARYQNTEEIERDLAAFVAEAGIEDPSAYLAKYLKDPEGVSASLRTSLVPKLTERGEAAMKTRDIPTALDYFNRVLAYDEGNTRVLSLIEKLGRRDRQRVYVMAAGIALGVVGLFGIAYAVGVDPETPPPQRIAEREHRIENPPPEEREPLVIAQNDTPDAGPADAGVRAHEATSSVPFAPGAPRRVCVQPTVGGAAVRDVSVAIDRGESCAVARCGCSELATGVRHRFEVDGACCRGNVVTALVPPGPGTFEVPVPMRYRARVHVLLTNGDVESARVAVENGGGGQARSNIDVDLGTELVARRRGITVTADGYRRHQELVDLRAGEVTQITVTLVPAPEGPTAERQPDTLEPPP